MRIKLFLILFILPSVMQAQSFNDNKPETANYPNCVFYEIFVRSFHDSNHDGIGDLNGITQKLDYLKALGIGAIWLTPIQPSPSYHKYDITDYYGIDKEYGTINDFKNLIHEAHQRNIKVILDMVINHCSAQHVWFKNAVNNPSSEYHDYFVWSKPALIIAEKNHWHVKRGHHYYSLSKLKKFDSNELAYYGYFWDNMPDLNYDNPKVRDEMIKVGQYWLTAIGVDGFRLDAAKWIYPESEPQKSQLWWVEYSAAMRKIKPDVFLVGEVTDSFENASAFLPNSLSAVFNFDLSFAIVKSIKSGKNTGIATLVESMRKHLSKISPNYIDATFLTNHDQNRIGSELNGDVKKIKLAASLLLTLPGSPFIYYGEEIGMLGIKPDEHIREPFLWKMKSDDSNRCNWIKPKYSNDKTVVPLEFQTQSQHSIFNHYKKLTAVRNSNEAMAFGELTPIAINDDEIIGYKRIYNDNELIILHNLSNQTKKVAITFQNKNEVTIIFSSNYNSKFDGEFFILAPFATYIIE